MSNGNNPLGEAATHPLMAIVFSLMFQALSNINGFNLPSISNYSLEISLIMMLGQIGIGAAYAIQSDADGALYLLGTIFGVYFILKSTFTMDTFGWVGAIGAVLLISYILLKKKR